MTEQFDLSPRKTNRRYAPQFNRRAMLQSTAAGAALGAAVLRGHSSSAKSSARNSVRLNRQVSGTVRYQLVSSDPREIADTQAFLDENFTSLYPDVTVRVEPQPDNRAEQLITAMIGGNAPDVFDTWRDDVVRYADVEQVLDVNDLVARDLDDDEINDFFEAQWNDFELPNGIRFGMPKYVNLMTVWCNLDALEAAGIDPPDDSWDHDTYADAARQLTVGSGASTDQWGLFFPAWGIDRYSYKLEAFGGSLVDPEDNTRAAFGDEPALNAAEWLRSLIFDDGAIAERNLVFPGGRGGVAATTDQFAAGRLAMVEDGLYPFAIASKVGDNFRWAFAPVPPGPAGRHVLGTADGYAIWSGSSNPEAAWELVKFLSGTEYQLYLTGLTGYLPSRNSLIDQWVEICTENYPELADANLELARQAIDEGYARNRPLFAQDSDAQAELTPALEAVFVTGDEDVSYLTTVADDITADQQG